MVHYERHGKSVLKAALAGYGGQLFLCELASLFETGSNLLTPIVLNRVITIFAAPEVDMYSLTLWLGVFFSSRLLSAVISAHASLRMEQISLRLQAALKALLFRKSMRCTIQSRRGSRTVDISNLFTSEIHQVVSAVHLINTFWTIPLQIGAIVYMLHALIGLAAYAGMAVVAISLLVSFGLAPYSGRAYEDATEYMDDRMKTIKEVFNAIQIVKLNAWEGKFANVIRKQRSAELSALKRVIFIGALEELLVSATPVAVSIVSFAVYSLVLGQVLTSATVFTIIALFDRLQGPLQALPAISQSTIQVKVSIDRFSEYLSLEEFEEANVTRNDPRQPDDVAISLENGIFGWTTDSVLLNQVNLTVKKRDLVIVYGAVGSGKSSLCLALLGEMQKLAGDVFVRGSVAYYSQETWIQNMTIRDNILFGLPYDQHKYLQVIAACGLLPDLHQLPGGDSTEIGQKGVNLSGGQKARLCLARACYSDADILLLDSPLAAVDAIVQNQIFHDCICTLLKDKTVVLVTHSIDIVSSKAANVKILVEDGKLTVTHHVAQKTSFSPSRAQNEPIRDENTDSKEIERLVDDEEREDGRVSKEVFTEYFHSLGGMKVCIFLFTVQTLWQVFEIGKTEYYIKVYFMLGAGAAFMVFVRSVTVPIVGLRASRHLFNRMTMALLKAPLRFFDANPIGRIVNRYADDMSAVDFMIPFAFDNFLSMFFIALFQLSTAVYTVNFLGFLIIPLVWMYVKIASFYLAPSREISRLWKASSSPVLSHITQSEEGVAVIRAFGRDTVEIMMVENFTRNDVNIKCWLLEPVTGQWLELRMQLIGCGIVFLVVMGLVYLRNFLSPGLVGLAFTYALSIDSELAGMVHMWSSLEILMISPERILQYVSIPSEGNQRPLVIEPDTVWPHASTIEFRDVVFSYKPESKPVLKGVSFNISNNETIGIVGRTGAGKSSLTMALFRVNELVSGQILIDGVDIAGMPLRSLRSKLSIIPQSPVLFKGALRNYMDPFDEFTDEDIWSALEKVDIKTQVSALEGKLAFELTENGDNFSVGERQMLCMVRALLTQSGIVVMDEATASIDHATEQKLQQMINREFGNATVLTIAHRLATVLNSDRIMVLSDRHVVEFDSPHELVKDQSSAFYRLAKEGGGLY
ncbi:hypothetical protein V7S43_015163 [Phytophthora oleae]|uniref:Multidrug resistance-associated protein 1 n=1 Tax=Phytophthora oleae TaxID=2107226 RepID=A0ABD3F2J1_9STRA